MNILYLIGNGFDLNLGMNTSYRDFYKHYSSIVSTSNTIANLKKEIERNIDNWSDLELALGRYTEKIQSEEEFNELFEDIEDRLAEYLEAVEDNFDLNQFDGSKLLSHFVFPEKFLPVADSKQINNYKSNWRNSQVLIDVITFNYTHSLEKILKFENDKPILVNKYVEHLRNEVYLNRILHIHGFYNERMVMGVNDLTQISNKSFHNNQVILESLIKTDCNLAQKHTIDEQCKQLIYNSQIICIFGSSIGATDNCWWKLIGERLKHNIILIIFEKGNPIHPRRPQKAAITERKMKNYFLNKTNMNDKERDEAYNKIFIGVNTMMFNINTDV